MIRLRKSVFAFIFGFHGFSVLATLGLVASLSVPLLTGEVEIGLLVGCGLFALLVAAGMFGSRVVLFEDRIESGLRWFPRVVERDRVVDAREGKVHWNRGFLEGVVVVTADGELVPVAGSAPMSKSAREAWIAAIRQWASSS